jgi:hypothetical protein
MNRTNRTFICSVVFLDIVEYSTRSVEDQIKLKQQLNEIMAEAVKDVAVNDRIILDTGDGAAIGFLGDPEDALFVTLSLQDAIIQGQTASSLLLSVRIGINLGPVKLVKDINNQTNLIGDGINVAQRVMNFAQPGQVLVSRSFYEVIACLSQEYARLFHYQGTRADKHIKEHEIYSVEKVGQDSGVGPALVDEQPSARVIERDVPEEQGPAELKLSVAPPAAAREAKRTLPAAGLTSRPWWRTGKILYALVPVALCAFVVLTITLRNPEKAGKGTVADQGAILTQKPPSAQIQTPLSKIPAAVPKCIIQFAVSPWGEVFIDGKSAGASPPMTTLTVAPGKHMIEIRNTSFNPHKESVEIKPNEVKKIIYKFH